MQRSAAWLLASFLAFAPLAGAVTQELIVNGDFERGRGQGWNEFSSGGLPIVTSNFSSSFRGARSGAWAAWLGGFDNATEAFEQDVVIPQDAQELRLAFWYHIVTEEPPTDDYDTIRVSLIDPANGAVLADARISSRNPTSQFVQSDPLTLLGYRGSLLRVRFAVSTDNIRLTNFFIDDVSLAMTREPVAPAPSNYSDIWWNPDESGWGLTIADHQAQLFAVWYTYREDGTPTWFVIPGGAFSQGRRIFTGDMYVTTGPRYDGAFNANAVTVTRVGSATIDFAPAGMPAGTARFTYSVGGVTGSKAIQRQPFGNALPSWGTDLTDIWWNSAESGWGLTLAQHGNNVFGVWFTYDTSGRPLWVVMPGVTFNGSTTFSGALYTTTGPYYGGPFASAPVRVTEFGSAALDLQFTGSSRSLRFRPTVPNASLAKPVTRQPF